jgi:hypothetical protein
VSRRQAAPTAAGEWELDYEREERVWSSAGDWQLGREG